MSETMVEDHKQKQQVAKAPAPAPRRPRVREVSSRFMSPIVSSSSSGDLHVPASKQAFSNSAEFHSGHQKQQQQQQQQVNRSKSVQRQHPELMEPLSSACENRLWTARSLETPLASQSSRGVISMHRKQNYSVKLSKENRSIARSRIDTPTVHSGVSRTTNIVSVANTAAAKLVQSSGMTAQQPHLGNKIDVGSTDRVSEPTPSEISVSSDLSDTESCTDSNHGGKCSSPPISVMTSKMRSLQELRSSMPEADMLPTMSCRSLGEKNCSGQNINFGDHSKISASPCYRSLNTPLSSGENTLLSPVKSVTKSSSTVFSKPYMKVGTGFLPPHPTNTKLGTDARKGKKASGHQEEVHALRLLHNRCLQWRYANAKAEASIHAQRSAAEMALYALGVKMSELHNSVRQKRSDLLHLRKMAALSNILGAQEPYLDEWSALEGDYSSSLSGTIKALQDASVRVPVSGNVRAEITEVREVMDSALNMMETMSYHVQSFLPKAEEMDTLICALAGLSKGEKALIEECGDLLSTMHTKQVEECSLRGQLMQLNRDSICNSICSIQGRSVESTTINPANYS